MNPQSGCGEIPHTEASDGREVTGAQTPLTALLVIETEAAFEPIGGRSPLDRLRIQSQMAGVKDIYVVASPTLGPQSAQRCVRLVEDDEIREILATVPGLFVIIGCGALYDDRLIARAVSCRRPTVFVNPARDEPPAPHPNPNNRAVGIAVTTSGVLRSLMAEHHAYDACTAALRETRGADVLSVDSLPTYHRDLRRHLRPYCFTVRTEEDRSEASWLLAKSNSKGHMEWVAVVVNRPIEVFLSRYLSGTRLTPDALTILTSVVALLATMLFASGRLGLGVAVALLVGILDGLDGRQARIQLRFSRFGRYEHWLDKGFELLWMFALGWHFSRGLEDMSLVSGTVVWVAFYVTDLMAYGLYRAKTGILIDETTRLDATIRFFGGRRNTYIGYLGIGLLLGHPVETFWFLVGLSGVTALTHWSRVGYLLSHPSVIVARKRVLGV